MANPPVFLTREFHGQRSLVGYSPCSPKSWTQLRDLYIFTLFFLNQLSHHYAIDLQSPKYPLYALSERRLCYSFCLIYLEKQTEMQCKRPMYFILLLCALWMGALSP